MTDVLRDRHGTPQARDKGSMRGWMIGAGLAAVAAIAALLWFERQPDDAVPATQATAEGEAADGGSSATAEQAATGGTDGSSAEGAADTAGADGTAAGDADAPAPAVLPSFDIVTVEPSGRAVIAGRAEPGAEITVLLGGQPRWHVVADGRGEFVLLPEEPLPSGTQTLTLEAKLGDAAPLASSQAAVIDVPARATASAAADAEAAADGDDTMVAIVESGTDEAPALVDPSGAGLASQGDLMLDLIDNATGTQSTIAGRAAAGTEVRAYVDGSLVGRAVTDAEGRWSIAAPLPGGTDGTRELRVDQVDAEGKVLARLATKLEPVVPADLPSSAQAGSITVLPGNTLWQIARNTYGVGLQYTVIFRANQDRISDPDLIYPGQVFVLPPPEAGQGG